MKKKRMSEAEDIAIRNTANRRQHDKVQKDHKATLQLLEVKRSIMSKKPNSKKRNRKAKQFLRAENIYQSIEER